MKPFKEQVTSSLSFVWRHGSAAIVVILVIAALLIGYQIGSPDPETKSSDSESSSGGEPQLYTCSMHPSVRLPDPDAKCPICFMDLIPITEDEGGEGSERRIVLSEAAVKLSEVETTNVRRFFPTAEVRLFGKVTYDETRVARLTAYFPGRLDRLFVNYLGVTVAKGDHVAEIYSPDLLAAFEELRQARAAVDTGGGSSKVLRGTTQDTLEAAREKLRLFGITPEQIAAVENGSFEGDRLTVHAPLGGVVTHLGAREGDYLETGTPVATVADLSRLWLDLEAYESQMPMLRWGQSVEFSVESHPGVMFEGRIAFIEPFVDQRTRTAAVRVAVDNTDGRLRPGMFASAVVRPRIGTNGAVLSDELAGRWVSPMHPTIVKDGPGECEVCGMELVRAESLGVVGDPSSVEEPLAIPRTAVLFTGTRSVVYVRVPDTEKPTYEGREVVLGVRAGDFYTIRWGLREGEAVVTNGSFRIDSAMQLAAKPSMMSSSGEHASHGSMGGEGSGNRTSVPAAFVHSLKPVYSAYLDAQEALAADDFPTFQQAHEDLQRALGFVEDAGLLGTVLGDWRRAAAILRRGASFESIEEARQGLEKMTKGVIALDRRFGHHGTKAWFVAYCPMAFDNTGAEWLQRDDKISNPYFGASMLRCGEIRAELHPLGHREGGSQ